VLLLSPLVAVVEDRRGAAVRYGLAHRLTGQSLGISPDFAALLHLGGDPGGESADLSALRASPEARGFLDILTERHFLVSSLGPENLLKPFRNHCLIRPWMNPAITWRDGEGTRLVRLRDTQRCILPRGPVPPRVVEELVPAATAAILRQADGSRTLEESLHGLGSRNLADLWEPLDFLTRPQRQAVRLAPPGTNLGDPRTPLHWLQQSFEAAGPSPSSSCGEERRDTGRPFYEKDMDDALWNFDWVEPTVSHAFRFPTAALHQRTYGERLCEGLLGERLERRPQAPFRILEIGGGAGFFARAFLGRAEALRGGAEGLHYTVLDCSPALQEQQRETLREAGCPVRFILGNAEELSLPGERFDLVVANEVIADFTVTAFGEEGTERWVHSGVLAFLDRLAAHLAPGGMACLTEYGDLETDPSRVEHLNHSEYSIDFGSLMRHAEGRGLAPALRGLAELLAVRSDAEMLCGQQERILCLNHLLSQAGGELPYAAFCRQGFEERCGELANRLDIGGLAFAPLRSGLHFGPALEQFRALLLEPAGG
jgi:hypothetical protein